MIYRYVAYASWICEASAFILGIILGTGCHQGLGGSCDQQLIKYALITVGAGVVTIVASILANKEDRTGVLNAFILYSSIPLVGVALLPLLGLVLLTLAFSL